MNKFEFKKLTPFKWFVLENFPFIEADFDALTEWQLFCKLGKEMNKIINSENTLGTQVENVTNAFNYLQNYVNNYFENLDIQEEVNNKLNEMAESGELAELISQYLESQAVIGFNTTSALSQATNLANGSIARTLGRNQYNDGYGAFYKIRQRTNSDTPDGYNIIVLTNTENLIAERILNQSIINLENEVEELKEPTKKYLFVGDSYGDGYTPDGNVTAWQTVVKNLMGLTNEQFKTTHRGGYGFGISNNFYSLIEALDNDNTITDIIIGGGYNDLNATETSIKEGILNCYNLCKTKFPNAKFYVAFFGWSRNGESKTKLANTFKYYRNTCFDNPDLIFIEGIHTALHHYFKYFSSDGYHPNQLGQNNIAKGIVQFLKYGKVNIYEEQNTYFEPVNGTTGGVEWKAILNNGIVHLISTQEAYFQFVEEVEGYPNLHGNSLLKVATLNTSLIVGGDKNQFSTCGIPCVVQTTDNKYHEVLINVIIKNGELYLQSNLINDAQNNYGDLIIKAIQMNPFNTSCDALYC